MQKVDAVAPEADGVEDGGEGFGGVDLGDAHPADGKTEDDECSAAPSGYDGGVGSGEGCEKGCNEGGSDKEPDDQSGWIRLFVEKELGEVCTASEEEEVVCGEYVDGPTCFERGSLGNLGGGRVDQQEGQKSEHHPSCYSVAEQCDDEGEKGIAGDFDADGPAADDAFNTRIDESEEESDVKECIEWVEWVWIFCDEAENRCD